MLAFLGLRGASMKVFISYRRDDSIIHARLIRNELAQRFEKDGDKTSHDKTLKFLIERYPNSRFAIRAKNDLERSEQ